MPQSAAAAVSPPPSRSHSSYITLTPRSNEPTAPSSSSLAKEILARKLEAGKKRDGRDLSGHDSGSPRLGSAAVAAGAASGVSVSGKTATKDSPTETDKSSEIDLDIDAPEQDDEDLDASGEADVLPAYVCSLHDPKSMLREEHVRSTRVEISLITAPKVFNSENKDKRCWGWHSKHVFRYEITVGLSRSIFECTPSKVLDVLKSLARDPKIADQLRLIETNYFRDGFVGSMKRIYPCGARLSDEIVEVLESLSDIDAVLLHNTYLQLIGITKGTVFYKALECLVESHSGAYQPEDDSDRCMCDTYQKSVDRFGDMYKQHQQEADAARFSVVASESLMSTRNILSFYTDTVYTMDKRDFRPWRGLNKCTIYGFGRRKLFEIVRTSRKQWSFRHVNVGTVATLTLERYMHHMNPYQMVAIKRVVPDPGNGGMREENICFVKKSKQRSGYRCLLMSEVICRGRVTTALHIEEADVPQEDGNFHYMTMCETSGNTHEPVCSSTLSVPICHYKHCQRLHISGGSDVVAFIAMAVSYDILVGSLAYWKERRY